MDQQHLIRWENLFHQEEAENGIRGQGGSDFRLLLPSPAPTIPSNANPGGRRRRAAGLLGEGEGEGKGERSLDASGDSDPPDRPAQRRLRRARTHAGLGGGPRRRGAETPRVCPRLLPEARDLPPRSRRPAALPPRPPLETQPNNTCGAEPRARRGRGGRGGDRRGGPEPSPPNSGTSRRRRQGANATPSPHGGAPPPPTPPPHRATPTAGPRPGRPRATPAAGGRLTPPSRPRPHSRSPRAARQRAWDISGAAGSRRPRSGSGDGGRAAGRSSRVGGRLRRPPSPISASRRLRLRLRRLRRSRPPPLSAALGWRHGGDKPHPVLAAAPRNEPPRPRPTPLRQHAQLRSVQSRL
ncbi:proline-rich protein HaeIII subfamily 1-like [Muntiacus reevesi]|uniref:proline-rich protein HaeIII subfamily 1-like n=1 Tax=Muntiacus reevesi TaxID=9886 RepID=UPI00330766F3